MDGLEDGVIPGVGKAVVSAHHHPVFPFAHLLIDVQTVLRHALDGVVGLHRLAAIGTKTLFLLLRKRQHPQHRLVQDVVVGYRVGAAAEVGVNGLLEQFRAEKSGVPLSAGEHHRLFLRHSLQSGAGHAHKHLAGRGDGVDVGTGPGEYHAGSSQLSVGLLRPLLQLGKAVAAPGDQDMDSRVGLIQSGRQLNKLPGRVAGRLVQSADVADDQPIPKAELLPHWLTGYVGRKLVGVNAVDGEGNVLRRNVILPN